MVRDCNALGFPKCYVVERTRHHSGGLALAWKAHISCDVVGYSQGHIDGWISQGEEKFRLIGFYGNPDSQLRRHSWELLRRVVGGAQHPVIVIGDFNGILELGEKFGGPDKSLTQIQRFRDAIERCNLVEVNFDGPAYTWSNGSVLERLDRAFANGLAFNAFSRLNVYHVDFGPSDHLPIFLTTKGEILGSHRSKKRQLFESFWAKEEDSRRVVEEFWRKEGSGSLGLVAKLRGCLKSLSEWNKQKIGNVPWRIRELKKKDYLQPPS